MRYTIKLLITACISLMLHSCEKEKKPELVPAPTPADSILTDEKMIGKWEAFHSRITWYEDGVVTHEERTTKDQGYYQNGVRFGAPWSAEDVSMISFGADHKYLHFKPNGDPKSLVLQYALLPTGQWQIKNSEAIQFTETQNDTTVYDGLWEYDYLNDTLALFYYEEYEQHDAIKATRIEIMLEKQ